MNNKSLALSLADSITKSIVCGDFHAGERIQEHRIVTDQGVSRGTVREAFLILEKRHLVDIIPNKGVVVSQLKPNDIEDLYRLFLILMDEFIGQFVAKQNEDIHQEIQTWFIHLDDLNNDGDSYNFIMQGFSILENLIIFTENRYLLNIMLGLQSAVMRLFLMAMRKDENEIFRIFSTLKELVELIKKSQRQLAYNLVEDFCNRQLRLINEI